jgi:hypothetical protein
MITLSDTARDALQGALVSRGPRKGLLLSSAPPSQTLAYAAWQGAMLACNPYKASIAALLFMTPEQRAIQAEITTALDTLPRPVRAGLDKDRAALEALGVW